MMQFEWPATIEEYIAISFASGMFFGAVLAVVLL